MENRITFLMYTDINLFHNFLVLKNNIKKNYENNEFQIFLGITKEVENKYSHLLKGNNINYKVVDAYIEKYPSKMYGHVTKMANARLYSGEIFPELFELERKIVYIDIDTLILNKIPKHYFENKNNIAVSDSEKKHVKRISNWMNAVINDEIILKKNLSLLNNLNYFNSGVIIINSFSNINKLFNKVKEANLMIDDQNMLNFFNDGEIKVVHDKKINFQPEKFSFKFNISIIHFTGEYKPWNNNFNSKYKYGLNNFFIKIIYSKNNYRSRVLFDNYLSDQLFTFAKQLENNVIAGQLATFHDVKKIKGIKKIKNWKKRKSNKEVNDRKNQKIINKYDIAFSQTHFVHSAPNFRVKFKKSPIVYELFHGTLLKNPYALAMYKNKFDYIVSPNPYTTSVFKSIGINDDKIVKIGYPRISMYNDLLNDEKIIEKYNKIFNELKIMNKNKIIFAPTWIWKETQNELLEINIDSILDKMDSKKDVLIICEHNNAIQLKNLKYIWSERNNDKLILNKKKEFNSYNSWEIMLFSDKMITDYSSIIFDFGNLKGFENIEFFWPNKDKNQNDFIINKYDKYYSSWGSFHEKNIYEMDLDDYKTYFSNYDHGKWDARERLVDITLDELERISAKKNVWW